jgi:hypothetical protein
MMFTAIALVCGLVGEGLEQGNDCMELDSGNLFETEFYCQDWILQEGLLSLLLMLSESGQYQARVEDVYCQEYLGEAL